VQPDITSNRETRVVIHNIVMYRCADISCTQARSVIVRLRSHRV
jgi:hypothetical protein